jgi:peptidoglycan glycosyltransferase
MAAVELAELGIGQGRLAVTPLAMARLVAIVARRGILIQPYVVQTVRGVAGAVIRRHSGSEIRAFSAPTSEKVGAMMREAVVRGTGQGANLGSISVAGKTGTAENPHGPSHAWFVAYAPADDPRVAVSVVVENGGSGGQVAAPIAAEVIRASLSGSSDNR